MNCENCRYYVYDEEYDEYVCDANMDEDDYAVILQRGSVECPYWRSDDEYAVVRHQM
jgi:hypothetical protein